MNKVNTSTAKQALAAYVNDRKKYEASRLEIMERGGEYIRALRKEQKWSLRKMGELMGTHFTNISHLEAGRSQLSPAMAERLLAALIEKDAEE